MSDPIKRPRRLVLIRHAESARNQNKKGNVYFSSDEERAGLRGTPDHKIPITMEGHRQAIATGIALRERFGVPDYLYHSGYLRTEQTAGDILRAYSPEELNRIQVRMNSFLRERDAGHAYDMTTKEAEEAFPWLAEYWKTFGGWFARPPGGQSLDDVAKQVYLFLGMLFRDRSDKTVFAVTHGGTLRCFRFLLERWTYDQALSLNGDPKPDNCGVTVYTYDESLKKLALQEYNTVFWQANIPTS